MPAYVGFTTAGEVSLTVKVFIQRPEDGFFIKALDEWVVSKEEAMTFNNRTPAIDFCAQHDLRHVQLCLSFGGTHPDLLMEVTQAETRALLKFNRELRKSKDTLLQEIDLLRAESKERKKQIPFKRKRRCSEL